jgi:hypothetical protein
MQQFKEIHLTKKDLPVFFIQFFNLFSLIGLVLFLFSIIFFYQTFKYVQKSSFYSFSNAPTTNGIITNKWNARMEESGIPTFAYEYSFEVNSKNFTGKAFSTDSLINIKDSLLIQYKKTDPTISKPVNMGSKPWSWLGHFGVLLFSLIGLGFIIAGYIWGKKFIASILHEIITDAIFTHSKIDTSSDSTTWNNYYKFEDESGNLYFTHETGLQKESCSNQKVIYKKDNPKENRILNFSNIHLLFCKKKLEFLLLHSN